MPRKEFLRDLADVAVPGRFPCISDIRTGEYDGSISFTFAPPGASLTLDLQAIVSDSHDYPNDHGFLAFSSSENCPKTVTSSLENAVSSLTGLTIHALLSNIENIITKSMVDPGSPSSHPEDPDTHDSNDDESAASDTEPDWGSDDKNKIFTSTQSETQLSQKIRRDLRAAKNAGFKVGYLGSKHGTIIVTMSCRISKLAISEEAMDAWSVEPSEYLVLLIRYRPTYLDLQTIIETAGDPKNSPIQMYVGLCHSYKPSLEHAMEAIQGPQDRQMKGESTTSDKTMCGHLLRPLFIGRSLNLLLGERLLGIIILRLKHGFSWTGGEIFFQTNQGRTYGNSEISSEEYCQPDYWAASTPAILVADHMTELDRNISTMSLPLLAMQFTLRHFVKCTEFCLVCHCKIGDTFESLKPYVCSNALCLYQYMALGLGPSLEYEIRSQPFVVDLLTSLAYARASAGLLEHFPTGLRLRVPENLLPQKNPDSIAYYTGEFNATNLEIRLNQLTPVKVGDWIVIIVTDTEEWHCHVEHVGETSNHIVISPPISKGHQLQGGQLGAEPRHVKLIVYDTNLDDLAPVQKQRMISCLLGILPGIGDMKAFIESHERGNLLSSWRAVISPAGLDLLRWVVSSNRSFIKQDDDKQHKVVEMSDYVQFRLVQGAADKEQRFINAVNSNSLAQNPNHPTIFAWHGSSVNNWHSILREGFHFKQVIHGRACGDGVYMSNQFYTSLAYTGTTAHFLPMLSESRLKLATVISLNEVVNAPEKFVSHSPHYVVQHLDWIQPRYLFVKLSDFNVRGTARGSMPKSSKPQPPFHKHDESRMYKQDQRYLALGPNGKQVKIPISIFSGPRGKFLARETGLTGLVPSPKRRKYSVENTERHDDDDDNDDNVSIETAVEDLSILLSDDEMSESLPGASMQGAVPENVPETDLRTDFRPETLQDSSLPTLSPPQFATSSATKILQQHLQATIKIQARVPLHELGWYVDPSLITTVYQWIVELHTFDPSLPLAKDLKAINQKSIVLELRFPPKFPMDPPLVRVIRPRFVEFNAGGGGHVTTGGSMCMELLTHSGWLPTASIESVLLQVRMALTNKDPRPARLNRDCANMDYSVGGAVEAYRRVAVAHGWQISKDIEKLAW
ncbi:hypothetical protein PENNAL_c0056G00818 [Penicillium nalgiovense]|uniref:UBC core domain-containing protein n=1 Tax=Penicillium nalgiovense TaxID=60175 RepID=A0A1V6XTI6_PENNA|nr:hypothetical protein PENNAL_c0056G00818 [Penicillium nalgiovense]